MNNTKGSILEFLIDRSFKTKTAVLFLGAILILIGTEIRIHNPVLGYVLISVGLLTDWGIVYIVYVEISRIRDEIQNSREKIEEAKSKVEMVKCEVEEAHEKAEDAKGYSN